MILSQERVVAGLCAIKPQDTSVSREKAWLLGHIAGDGSVTYKPGRVCQIVVAAGTHLEDAGVIVRKFDEVYGAHATVKAFAPGKGKRTQTNYIVRCSWRLVVEDVLGHGIFGVYRWRIDERVLSAPLDVRAGWVSGFADAEGHVQYIPETFMRRISLTSINHKGLEQVSGILRDLEIDHRWETDRRRGPETRRESYRLILSYHRAIRRFAEVVNFESPRKRDTLALAISTMERDPVHRFAIEDRMSEIQERREAGETHAEIADSMGFERKGVADACYRHGIEPRGREGNADAGRRSNGLGRVERLLPRILELRDQGLKSHEIAKSLGFKGRHVVEGALRRAARKGAIPHHGRGWKLQVFLPQVNAMRAQGKTFREIGETLSPRRGQTAALWAIGIVQRGKKLSPRAEGAVPEANHQKPQEPGTAHQPRAEEQ
jgi:hypothetical protein